MWVINYKLFIFYFLQRAKSSGRVDDNEDTIKKRLDTFHKVSEPVIQKYKKKVASIKAEGTADEIFAVCVTHVDKALENLK